MNYDSVILDRFNMANFVAQAAVATAKYAITHPHQTKIAIGVIRSLADQVVGPSGQPRTSYSPSHSQTQANGALEAAGKILLKQFLPELEKKGFAASAVLSAVDIFSPRAASILDGAMKTGEAQESGLDVLITDFKKAIMKTVLQVAINQAPELRGFANFCKDPSLKKLGSLAFSNNGGSSTSYSFSSPTTPAILA